MSDEILQIDYDQMELIAEQFQTQSDTVEQMLQSLNQPFSELQNGGWIGEAADAFFLEYETELQPAIQRLLQALQSGSEATQRIIDVLGQAEEEAANQFTFEGDGEAPTAEGVGGVGEGGNTVAPPIQATEPMGWEDQTQPTNPNEIFEEDYYDDLFEEDIEGVGDEGLKDAMSILSGNPSPAEVDKALDQIAEARGIPREQVQTDYEQFLVLKAESDATAIAKGKEPSPPLNQERHRGFMGSEAQLQTGKIIGDALGIDPVFGSLLNPTGGIVGAGNDGLPVGENYGVGRHGIIHDAAGYLYNHHDAGPGYDYLGLESDRNTGNPFTGQQSGIEYWNEKMGETGTIKTLTELAGDGMGTWVDVTEFIDEIPEKVDSTIDYVSDRAQDVYEDAVDVKDQVVDTVQDSYEYATDTAGEFIDDAQETASDVYDWFSDFFD